MEVFFVLPVRGAYTWRGLFSEFYGILVRNKIVVNPALNYISK